MRFVAFRTYPTTIPPLPNVGVFHASFLSPFRIERRLLVRFLPLRDGRFSREQTG